MIKPSLNPDLSKSKHQRILELVLFAVCLCVIGLRVVHTEGLNLSLAGQSFALSIGPYSLSISAVLITLLIIWFLWSLLSGKFAYRITGIEAGLLVFCIAAVIAFFPASNKRIAITDSVTLLAPMLMAILLIQILDSKSKVNILLRIISILGVISALYCAGQFFWINDAIIEQYQNDPNIILEKLAIKSDSFQQMLFEHSLYSKDVRGFFVTGNSAGSFALLALFAAVAMFIEDIRSIKSNLHERLGNIVASGIIALLCLLGLLMTASKGAIGASIIAAALITCCIFFGNWLKAHKKVILAVGLLIALIVGTGTILYGVTHGRLPGGNSMLVRWQYWKAAVKMYADHPLTGVGPGNFANFYTIYKNPAALETVSDPHNFLLSILTQYGPIGLVGFLTAVFVPFAVITFKNSSELIENKNSRFENVTLITLCSAIAGFLIHNCIDFALFEPGILTAFWAIIACTVVLGKKTKLFVVNKPPVIVKIIVIAAAILVIWTYFNYALIPVAKARLKTQQAMQEFSDSHQLLEQAAKDDTLSPIPVSLKAKIYLQRYNQTNRKIHPLLNKAADCLREAIKRDRVNYRNYERLSDTYNLLAEAAKQDTTDDFLNRALENAQLAVKYYPDSGQLRLKLASIANRLAKDDIAVENYKKAIQIEDAYRKQFQIMYPGEKIFSRLGQDNYNLAVKKLKILTNAN